nr:MAG TPA: hypothetical protein [Caudoviricetes sp.]
MRIFWYNSKCKEEITKGQRKRWMVATVKGAYLYK